MKCKMKFFEGAIFGMIMGVMFAPNSGKNTRKCICEFLFDDNSDFLECIKYIEEELKKMKNINSFDDALDMKKDIEKKADMLVDKAISEGNKKKKKISRDIRKKVADTTNDILVRLDNGQNQ